MLWRVLLAWGKDGKKSEKHERWMNCLSYAGSARLALPESSLAKQALRYCFFFLSRPWNAWVTSKFPPLAN